MQCKLESDKLIMQTHYMIHHDLEIRQIFGVSCETPRRFAGVSEIRVGHPKVSEFHVGCPEGLP